MWHKKLCDDLGGAMGREGGTRERRYMYVYKNSLHCIAETTVAL